MNPVTMSISKVLSRNDVGATGSHQSGILIPKRPEILSFFPYLDPKTKNPRIFLIFTDLETHSKWKVNFIYYNSRLFEGTRNEYRLTCATKYLSAVNAKPGNILVFEKDNSGNYFWHVEKTTNKYAVDNNILVLSNMWRIIKI